MRLSILGPFRLEADGRQLSAGGSRQRAVLVYLALNANQAVASERLLVELWGEDVPASAANALQAAVSRLRKVLPPERLVTQPPGYLLRLQPEECDVFDFEVRVSTGREQLAAGQVAQAAASLRSALRLWRGRALVDFSYEPFAQTEIARLEEQRLSCLEDRIDADLALGSTTHDLVAELTALVAQHPIRERLRGQLMRGLYRAGRQAEALEVFRELRHLLREDLGIDPSPELVQLEAAILRHDPALRALPTPAASPVMARRPISLLAIDLHASAGADQPLDPEALHLLRQRVERLLTPVVQANNGRFVPGEGDRLCGVFGLSGVHEDDALRACRSAAEARAVLTAQAEALQREGDVRLACRFAVATGEALVGADTGAGFVGSASLEVARLLEAAQPWQILLGTQTKALAGTGAQLETLPGKLTALAAVNPNARPRQVRLDGPTVGRESELESLTEAVAAAARDRRTTVVTVLGEAGLGKTRLAHELARRLGPDVQLLTGRCPSFGEGITFWPLRELIRQATQEHRPPRTLEQVLAGEPDAAEVAGRLGRAFGTGAVGSADAAEVFWATRRLLEVLARRRPLVVVLEDLHWAEPTFLDLVESAGVRTGRTPLTVICLARPELLDQRPDWGVRPGGQLITLRPLPAEAARELLAALTVTTPAGRSAQERIVDAAGGNPLYLEQLVAASGEQPGDGSGWQVPPTLQALLSARLDRLGPGERTVLASAAVVGRDFGRAEVCALLPEEAQHSLDRHLQALIGRGLLQREPTGSPDGRFSFRHNLIQQAAYRAVPKSERAHLHQTLADWLEREPDAARSQGVALVGYHLEQAVIYLRELRPLDPDVRSVTDRAVERLRAAGEAAHELGDASAAVRFFERADLLLSPVDPVRAEVLTSLGAALFGAGRLRDAGLALDRAQALATEQAADSALAHARVQTLLLGLQVDPRRAEADAVRLLPELRRGFTRRDDPLGLCRVWMLEAAVHWNNARSGSAEHAWERAAEQARRAGDRRHLVDCLGWLASAALWGPTPARVGIARCESYLAEMEGVPTGRAEVYLHVAGLHAMQDDIEQADELLSRGIALLQEVGGSPPTAITEPAALVAMLSGRPERAEALLRHEYDTLQQMGEKAQLATVAALMAQAMVAQGTDRHPEAEELISLARSAGGDDPIVRILANGAYARIVSTQGDHEHALALAELAVSTAARTDMINQQADALLDLARVLAGAGRSADAEAAVREAIDRYRVKQNVRGVTAADRLLISQAR